MNMKVVSNIKSKNDVKVQDFKDVEWLKSTQNWRQNTNIYTFIGMTAKHNNLLNLIIGCIYVSFYNQV